jgi:hypothetical protein
LPALVATNDCAFAPPIGLPLRSHWYDAAALAVSVTLPPGQIAVGPPAVIDGVNVPSATFAAPVVVQPFAETLTLMETAVVPAVNVMPEVPWPLASVPPVTVQTYVAPAVGDAMLAAAVELAQTEEGALIVADGAGLAVTLVAADVPLQPPPFATVTL